MTTKETNIKGQEEIILQLYEALSFSFRKWRGRNTWPSYFINLWDLTNNVVTLSETVHYNEQEHLR